MLRGNIPILQRIALGRLELQATRGCSDFQSNREGFLASRSCLNHILTLMSHSRGNRENRAEINMVQESTYLQEILKFIRKLVQAGAVVRNGLPCFLKLFA